MKITWKKIFEKEIGGEPGKQVFVDEWSLSDIGYGYFKELPLGRATFIIWKWVCLWDNMGKISSYKKMI